MLRVNRVSKYFGSFAAVKNLSFEVEKGIFGIAGPNGAGKSTLFNVMTGVYPPNEGTIEFNGKYIHKMKPHKIYRLGISRTFQIPNVFLNLSVLDNVLVSVKFAKKKSVDPIGDAVEALRLVSLDNRKDERAGTLNLFNKKLLMVATGLAADTKLLLLDEPIGGLNPVEVERTMDLIREVSKHGVSIILIEHIMKAIMGLSDRIMIMHYGEKLAEGTPEEVTNDQNVVQAYLGEKYV